MSDTEAKAVSLMETASKQLEEHKAWLAAEIRAMPADIQLIAAREMLATQAGMIRLRVVQANRGVATVVYDYPDELYAFLKSDVAPKHLRDTLAGGHGVDTSTPTFTVKRVD